MKPTCSNCFCEFNSVEALLMHQISNECTYMHDNVRLMSVYQTINQLAMVPVDMYHFNPACCE